METRARILDVARHEFGRLGYSGTTTKSIAEGAELTIGALYYYFPTKQDLFATLFRDVYARVLKSFQQSVDGIEGLPNKIAAMMNAASAEHAHDPSMAAFLSVAQSDVHRYPALKDEVRAEFRAMNSFFEELVRSSNDELASDVQPESVVALLTAVMEGFSQYAATNSTQSHRSAIETFNRLVRGTLFSTTAR